MEKTSVYKDRLGLFSRNSGNNGRIGFDVGIHNVI